MTTICHIVIYSVHKKAVILLHHSALSIAAGASRLQKTYVLRPSLTSYCSCTLRSAYSTYIWSCCDCFLQSFVDLRLDAFTFVNYIDSQVILYTKLDCVYQDKIPYKIFFYYTIHRHCLFPILAAGTTPFVHFSQAVMALPSTISSSPKSSICRTLFQKPKWAHATATGPAAASP